MQGAGAVGKCTAAGSAVTGITGAATTVTSITASPTSKSFVTLTVLMTSTSSGGTATCNWTGSGVSGNSAQTSIPNTGYVDTVTMIAQLDAGSTGNVQCSISNGTITATATGATVIDFTAR